MIFVVFPRMSLELDLARYSGLANDADRDTDGRFARVGPFISN